MKKNSIRTLIVLAILLAVISVVLFVLPIERDGVFWLSYAFVVIAIAAQAFVLYTAFRKGDSVKSKLYGFPIARIGVLYLIVQLVMSGVFIALSCFLAVPVWIPVILYVVALGAAGIGLIATDAIREEVERQDEKIKVDVSCMRALQSKAAYLVSQCADAETMDAVEKFSDALKYSDPVSNPALCDIEHELTNYVDEIERAVLEGDAAGAIGLCKKTAATLAERNRLCKLNK